MPSYGRDDYRGSGELPVIIWKGNRFLYVEDEDFESYGAVICTVDQFENGHISEAHLLFNGEIWQNSYLIGHRDEITFTDEMQHVTVSGDAPKNLSEEIILGKLGQIADMFGLAPEDVNFISYGISDN
jgi:hypothetical protein